MADLKKRWAGSAAAAPTGGVTFLAVLLAGGLGLGACTKKDDEASKPAGIPASGAAPAPAPTAMPTPSAAQGLPPGHPAPPLPAAAFAQDGEGAPAADEPVDPKASIAGTVVLPAARRSDVSPSDTIFLVARRVPDNPQARGTLVAVKKLSAASFPIKFTLSKRDMMVPTGGFDGEVDLNVRVDKDGDPMTRGKGDVYGDVAKVKVGAQNVKVVLDHIRTEDESLAGSGPPPMMGGSLPPGHP